MAKKTGTKHHALIRLEELNKIFDGKEMIPIPKGYLKHIEWKLSAHNVTINEIPKDSASKPSSRKKKAEEKELQVIIPKFKD